jgi:hypothetical protein
MASLLLYPLLAWVAIPNWHCRRKANGVGTILFRLPSTEWVKRCRGLCPLRTENKAAVPWAAAVPWDAAVPSNAAGRGNPGGE